MKTYDEYKEWQKDYKEALQILVGEKKVQPEVRHLMTLYKKIEGKNAGGQDEDKRDCNNVNRVSK